MTGQGKFFNPSAELEGLRRVGRRGNLDFGEGHFGRSHIGTHAHGNPHPWRRRVLGHHRAGTHADQHFALARELLHANQKTIVAAQPIGNLALHATDLFALLGPVRVYLRFLAQDDGLFQSHPRRLEIKLDLQRRDAQRRTVVLEAVRRRRLGRQILGVVETHAQQISHRVAVFVARQPPEHNLAAGAAPSIRRTSQLARQPAHDLLLLRVGQRRGFLRRHFAQVQLVEHIVPGLGIGARHQIGVELVQPQIGLLLVRPVAADAQLLEHRLYIPAKRGQVRSRVSCGYGRQAHQQQ